MKIAVLPGDDIGPEITDATLAVLEAADRRFDLDLVDVLEFRHLIETAATNDADFRFSHVIETYNLDAM